MDICVSFVVPVYNVEMYVEQCIQSILNQTDSSYEVILINDGSKDQSGDICEKYANAYSQIKYISQENQGVSVARNHGIDAAIGKWICLVDGDDWVEANLVEQVKKVSESYDIIYYGYNDAEDDRKLPKQNDILDGQELSRQDFVSLQRCILNQGGSSLQRYHNIEGTPWAKLYRRDFLNQYKLRYTPNVRKGQDGLFNMNVYRYAETGYYSKDIIYNYRINEASVCRRYNSKIQELSRHLIDKYCEILKEINNEKLNQLFKYFALRQFMYCILLDYCHKDNKKKYKERKMDYLNGKKEYRTYIQDANLSEMKTKEKYLLILIRIAPFWCVDRIVKIIR